MQSRMMRGAIILFSLAFIVPTLVTFVLAAPGGTTISQFDMNCSSVTFFYFSTDSMGQDDAAVRITNLTTEEVLFNAPHGSFQFNVFEDGDTIEFDNQPNNSEIELFVEAGAVATASGICKGGTTVTPTPEEPEPSIPADGRFCYGPGAAPVALYGNGGGIDIYQIVGDEGFLIVRKSKAELAALPADASANLAGDNTGKIGFYKLGDGLYQVNVGPLADGKVHSCVFDKLPDYDAVLTSYNVYGQ